MAFASKSLAWLQAELADVEAKIAKAGNAEEYGIGSRSLRRNMAELQKREHLLNEAIADRADRSGGIGVVELGEPS